MQAVRLHTLGGPGSLVIEQMPQPVPEPSEVLVRLRAAALNHRDLFITHGKYAKIELPVTLGSDGAGEVAGLGSLVREFKIGDDVVINPLIGWGAARDVRSPNATILGMPRPGTFAQYVCVPAENVFPKPSERTPEEAAAMLLAGLTAVRALFTKGELRDGMKLLLPGIGGGVQTMALQLALSVGARVMVTSSSDEKLERAVAIGAHAGVNYANNARWEKEAKEFGPFDLVVDSSGGETFAKAVSLVRPGGRVIIYGGTHPESTVKLYSIFWNEIAVLGTTMGSPEDFRRLLELAPTVSPVIDRVYPLDEIVSAMQRMERGEQFGKIVLRIP